jgi:hypothetical protein
MVSPAAGDRSANLNCRAAINDSEEVSDQEQAKAKGPFLLRNHSPWNKAHLVFVEAQPA